MSDQKMKKDKSSLSQIFDGGDFPKTKKDTIGIFGKGVMMGAADLVPGVSGGTVAFITGIYSHLLAAISSINKEVVQDLLSFRIISALSKIHLRFLVPLAIGLVLAVFSLARLMHYLMNDHPIPTWGLFFGLIGASIIILAKELSRPFRLVELVWVVLGALFGYMVVGLIPVTTPDELWFIFLCGVIGISAMILPGLSGSFLLLVLGKYEFITGALKNPFSDGNFTVIIIFCMGAFTGLMGFSKILNYCLQKFQTHTMAFLTGLLIGSMKKVWPWKNVLETVTIRDKVRVLREENFLPEWGPEVGFVYVVMIIGFLFVLGMESYSSRKRKEL